MDLCERAADDPLPSQSTTDTRPGPELLPTDEPDHPVEEFRVEEILRVKNARGKGKRQALVKWAGYDQPQWQPLDNGVADPNNPTLYELREQLAEAQERNRHLLQDIDRVSGEGIALLGHPIDVLQEVSVPLLRLSELLAELVECRIIGVRDAKILHRHLIGAALLMQPAIRFPPDLRCLSRTLF